MKYFYIYVSLLSIFIIAMSYYNTIHNEGFGLYNNSNTSNSYNSNNKSIILLGDSILKNNTYTSNGKGVDDLLIERNVGKVYCYAEDSSKIVDIYSQINDIPAHLNNSNTTIFLSSGGNDLLSHYDDQGENIHDISVLKPMFSAYKKIVKSIQSKMSNAKLVLLDIYYPDNMRFRQYHQILGEWNQMLYDYANDYSNGINGVLRISGMLKNKEDFSFGIEPSSVGGEKIANGIMNYYYTF